MVKGPKYTSWNLGNFAKIPQVESYLTEEDKQVISVVGSVLPFKVNNYVVNELIDWNNIPADPIYQLTFPQRGMLSELHFEKISTAMMDELSKEDFIAVVNEIRRELNPHSSAQQDNIPLFEGVRLTGIQHKYKETVLFFPNNGQTCHAYCTYCFRWPQFVNSDIMKFAMKETDQLIAYIKSNNDITDLLITGGDPMIMSAKMLSKYIEPFLSEPVGALQNIRIGTKALGFWPYKFLTDEDSEDILMLFERIIAAGYHLTIMAHFNHPNELKTEAVIKAIRRILNTGVQIRTQSPIMRHINDSSEIWASLWKEQVRLGCIPYYMFIARDTGAQEYFAVKLTDALDIFKDATRSLSGIAKTAKGPVMSAGIGKVEILGTIDLNGERLFSLRLNQARNPDWIGKLFFAKYNENALWLNDLSPAFGQDAIIFHDTVNEDIF